jgi:hypothetical protein
MNRVSIRNFLLLLQSEPAVILLGVNAAVAIATTWGYHLSSQTTGCILVATTAALSALTAILARPASAAVIKGTLLSLLVAVEAFHFHISQPAIAGTAATLSILLGLLLRANLTPVVSQPPPPNPAYPLTGTYTTSAGKVTFTQASPPPPPSSTNPVG